MNNNHHNQQPNPPNLSSMNQMQFQPQFNEQWVSSQKALNQPGVNDIAAPFKNHPPVYQAPGFN